METPSSPGWYPDPSGKRGKKFWDGSEWFDHVPSSRKVGDPKVLKIVAVSAGLISMVGLAVGAIVLSLLGDDAPVPGPAASSALPNVPQPSTSPRYISVKSLPSDGVYKVGGDQVDPGVWESPGPVDPAAKPCTWARLSAPQLSPETTLETGNSPGGPTRVRILPTDAAFTTTGCQPWQYVAE